MENQLEKLEARVMEAIGLIKDLRLKNMQLDEQCNSLEERLGALSDERDMLQRKLDAVHEKVATADDFEAKRQLIEQKVGSLLEKLEAMG